MWSCSDYYWSFFEGCLILCREESEYNTASSRKSNLIMTSIQKGDIYALAFGKGKDNGNECHIEKDKDDALTSEALGHEGSFHARRM